MAVQVDSQAGARQVVFLGNGTGGLGAAISVSSAFFPTDIHAADVTGDGLDDLLSTSSTSPGGVNVTPNTTRVLASFALTAPASAISGQPFTITVTARDQFGTTITDYVGAVHFTSSDGAGSLPSDYTFTTADQGTKTFSFGVNLRTGGAQTVRVAGTTVTTVFASATVSVVPISIPTDTLPTITDVANQHNPSGAIGFTVGDVETPAAGLTVAATWTNEGLFPAGSVVLGGSGANRTITLTPASRRYGSATVTLTVTDGDGRTTADTFDVRIAPTKVELYAIGAGPGGAPHLRVFNGDGSERFSFFAYSPAYTGGVNVATGDVNGDGMDDVITGTLAGGGPHIKVFDGRAGQEIRSFMAYDPGFTGGLRLAVGDLTGDGYEDIVTGVGSGGGPHIQVFDGRTGTSVRSFFAYDPGFRGGVNVGIGDVTGDGNLDLVTGVGSGGGPHVQVFDGRTNQVMRSFMAYDPGFRGGINVAAGDANGDGIADIITGVGSGGGPHIRVMNGVDNSEMSSFYAYNSDFVGGVRVATTDTNGDGAVELLVSPGPGMPTTIRAFSANGTGLFTFNAYDEAFQGGVFIG